MRQGLRSSTHNDASIVASRLACVAAWSNRPVSAATRCVQTVEPLATDRQLPVIESQALWEGSTIAEAFGALAVDDAGCLVACSHGDIIPGLIDTLAGRGVPITGRGCELGSIWILDHEDGRWVGARYAGSHDADNVTDIQDGLVLAGHGGIKHVLRCRRGSNGHRRTPYRSVGLFDFLLE